jgi:hypothetical protein
LLDKQLIIKKKITDASLIAGTSWWYVIFFDRPAGESSVWSGGQPFNPIGDRRCRKGHAVLQQRLPTVHSLW